MSIKNQFTQSQSFYKIGAVSNITGLTTHTIRAWERRYDLEIAQRSKGNTRLYTEKGITLLSLFRDLIKRGDAIGEIAGLSEEALRERLKNYAPIPESTNSMAKATPYKESKPYRKLTDDSDKRIRAMVLDDTLVEYLASDSSPKLPWKVHCEASTPEDALAKLNSENVDVLLARIQNLGTDPVAFLEQWNAKTHHAPAIVFYELSNSALFAELVKLGVKMVKWPVDLAILSQMVTDYYTLHRVNRISGKGIEVDASFDHSKRSFSDAQLMKLCQPSGGTDSDYLKNIASLLFEINSLENYFNNLSSRPEENRALHLKLYQQTAKARALLESMLIAVCSHEEREDAAEVDSDSGNENGSADDPTKEYFR